MSICIAVSCNCLAAKAFQSGSLEFQVTIKKILMLPPTYPPFFFVQDYLVNLLTAALESLWQLQCYSIMGNSIMQQF